MIFELITGDFLFEPRKGETYSKNDDHLAQIMELLGKMPKKFALSGRYSKVIILIINQKYFNKSGNLRRIKGLQYWPLKSVLQEKYRIKEHEALALTDFLMPMLEYYPERRATAQEMLSSPWLNMPPDFDYKMSDREYERMIMIKKNVKKEKGISDEAVSNDIIESDSEINMADDEDNEEYISDDYVDSDDSCENPDLINIQNFNNSFAAYGQHVNLAALDRANPQFEKVSK